MAVRGEDGRSDWEEWECVGVGRRNGVWGGEGVVLSKQGRGHVDGGVGLGEERRGERIADGGDKGWEWRGRRRGKGEEEVGRRGET